MIHPCTKSVMRTVTALKTAQFSGLARQKVPLVPGAFFLWDEAGGSAQIETASEPGLALRAKVAVSSTPSWITLQLQMGPGRFVPGDVIGLIHDLSFDAEVNCALAIQSRRGKEYLETEFQEPLWSGPKRDIRVAMHTVSEVDGLPHTEEFHTLIIRLPVQDFGFELYNLRFFFLPASKGLKTGHPTLANITSRGP
ncbi:MAG: hypothetical protein AAGA97_00265 [Pseudomonadota bacterium]